MAANVGLRLAETSINSQETAVRRVGRSHPASQCRVSRLNVEA